MSRELIDWENVDTGKTREDAHKFINYWAFDVAAIKGEDEWSVLNGN